MKSQTLTSYQKGSALKQHARLASGPWTAHIHMEDMLPRPAIFALPNAPNAINLVTSRRPRGQDGSRAQAANREARSSSRPCG